MGDDFTNHQVFAGDNNPQDFRQLLLSELKRSLNENGFAEVKDQDQVDRSIAVGPAARWICIYDSSGNGDDADPLEDSLTRSTSRVREVD